MSGASLFGHPAMRLLVRLKFRGVFRAQLRRFKRPSGWIFAILGFVLFGLWLSSLAVSLFLQRQPVYDPQLLRFWTSIAILVLCAMTVVSAFGHRGLYLPKEEIELAFSSPIARGDLVRYRMGINLLRSVVAGILFGLGAARRMPVGIFAFVGVLVTLLTVPILGQATALMLGDAENRLGRLAKKLPLRGFAALLGAGLGIAMVSLLLPLDKAWHQHRGASGPVDFVLDTLDSSPVVRWILLPVQPWTRMITASELPEFVCWLAVCAGAWVLAWELTARIPIDYRETSLATSADLAKRLTRLRRGGAGLAGSLLSKPKAGWNVPWVLGHGRFGAIAWHQLTTIARKARGTFLFSTVIVLCVSAGMAVAWRDPGPDAALGGAAILAVFGTIYLCSGLRFDFRNDLDQMEQIKAWPARPAVVFFATVLPQVLVVSLMLDVGILLRCFATGGFHPGIFGILFIQPLVALAWTSVDNAVFLYYPVRYAPGQEGALQHVGRSVMMSFLRLGLAGVAIVVAVVPGLMAGFAAQQLLHLGGGASWTIGTAVAWLGLAAMDAALVFAGGKMLQRFDIARDRA